MASQLDGAGQIKMKTLDEAGEGVSRLHSLVERMGVAVRAQQPTAIFGMQIRRAATPLVGLLKGQFALIADIVSGIILIAGRGGGDQMRLRALRESVASLRTQLEIAAVKVKEKHTVGDAAHMDTDATATE